MRDGVDGRRVAGRRRPPQRGAARMARAVAAAAAALGVLAAACMAERPVLFGAGPPRARGAWPGPPPGARGPAVARRQQSEQGGCPVRPPAADGVAPAEPGPSAHGSVTDVMPSMAKIDVLQAALSEGRPLLVDFMAPRCPSCRHLEPALDLIEDYFKGRLRVLRVDVLQHRHFLDQLDFRRVPAVFLFEAASGQQVDSFIGSKARALDIVTSIEDKLLASH